MLLIVYIFICIMYGPSNTALQNDYFEGESSLAEVQNPELQGEESNRQRRFNSNAISNSMSMKFLPISDKGNKYKYSKDLRSFHDKEHFPENFYEKNEINSDIQNSRRKNSRRNSKISNRDAQDDAESIKHLFNKSGPPLEYLKKTFQLSVDSKEDFPELFRTKGSEKWQKKNLSHRTRMKNKGHSFKKGSKNFLKRFHKNKNRSMQKSKKRSVIDPWGKESESPMKPTFSHPKSECESLESFQLFRNNKLGKFFDPDLYKKCLLLRKTNKLELLIKNKGDTTKYFDDALHGDLFSVFKAMDRLPVTPLYESELPEESINWSDNIQKSSKSWENSDLLNTYTEIGNYMPINPNKLLGSLTDEKAEPSNKFKNIEDMYAIPNTITDNHNIDYHTDLGKGNTIDGNYGTNQIPQMQNVNENLPSINLGNSPFANALTDNYDIDYHTSLEKGNRINENYPFNQIPQKQNLNGNLPINLGNSPIAKEHLAEPPYFIKSQPLNNSTKNTYTKQVANQTPTQRQHLNKNLPIINPANSPNPQHPTRPPSFVELKPTKVSEIKKIINQTETSTLLTSTSKDIQIVFTESFVTTPRTTTSNILEEVTESDYSVNNPPVNRVVIKEEAPESDIKMLKMHYRHPPGTKEPVMRHLRQSFSSPGATIL